jgi:uroporphyrinogen decarboxylase
MTGRERVLAAIRRQPPDRAPMDFGGTMMSVCLPEFLEDMRRLLGFSLPEDRDPEGTWVDEQIQRYLDVDMRTVHNTIPRAILKEIDYQEYERRERTKKYIRMADRKIITHTVVTEFPLRGMSYGDVVDAFKPEPSRRPKDAHIDWYVGVAKKYREDGYATTFWVTVGFFEVLCKLRGYDQACVDLLLERDVAKLIFERLLEVRIKEVEMVVPALAPHIDLFCFGDDLSMQKGPFMSPELYREMIMPYQEQVYRRTNALAPDSYIFHHSCGSMFRLLPVLTDMGVGVLNPTQIGSFEMEPERLKSYDKICYHGGVDLQDVLPNYAPDDVTRETERLIKILAPGGGYLCAPCHSLPEDVPAENILAMFRADRRL